MMTGPWVVTAEGPPVFITPELEILDRQIHADDQNAQGFANRGYTLAVLGRKEEARADVRRSVALGGKAPTHNRASRAYFNMGDYADAVREFETAAKLSDRWHKRLRLLPLIHSTRLYNLDLSFPAFSIRR